MYGPLWRILPGPAWMKAIILLAVVVGLFFLLMEIVFPWVETMLPWTDVSVE